MEQEKEAIFKGGKKLGEINYKKGVYITYRSDEHYFRKFEGWGLSEKLIDYLLSKEIHTIVVNYLNKEAMFCSIFKFLEFGIQWDDNGDKQLILPEKYFTKYVEPLKWEQEKLT